MAEYIEREKAIRETINAIVEILGIHSSVSLIKISCKMREIPTADVVEVVKVAEILNNAFGNDCPCNFKNIDEWLPYVCEYADTCDCSSVKCWEQLTKHYGERRCRQ